MEVSYEELKTREIKKVRKEHSCVWCNFLIHVKESAIYRVYRFDGYFQTDYMHLECYEAMKSGDNCLDEHEDAGFEDGSFDRGGLICSNCE